MAWEILRMVIDLIIHALAGYGLGVIVGRWIGRRERQEVRHEVRQESPRWEAVYEFLMDTAVIVWELKQDVKQSCGCRACAHMRKTGVEQPCSECRDYDKWQYRRPRDKKC